MTHLMAEEDRGRKLTTTKTEFLSAQGQQCKTITWPALHTDTFRSSGPMIMYDEQIKLKADGGLALR